jgi:hypothetical protein
MDGCRATKTAGSQDSVYWDLLKFVSDHGMMLRKAN